MNILHCDVCDLPIPDHEAKYYLYLKEIVAIQSQEELEQVLENMKNGSHKGLAIEKEMCSSCVSLVYKLFTLRAKEVKQVLDKVENIYKLGEDNETK